MTDWVNSGVPLLDDLPLCGQLGTMRIARLGRHLGPSVYELQRRPTAPSDACCGTWWKRWVYVSPTPEMQAKLQRIKARAETIADIAEVTS